MAEAEKLLIDPKSVKSRRRYYETTYIVSPALSDAQAKEIAEKNLKVLEGAGAVILRHDDWGKKKMAYPIQRHAMGRYFHFRFVSTNDALKAFERSLKLDASILRFLSVRLSDPLSEDDVRRLQERAAKEPSFAPTVRGDDDEQPLEASSY